MAMIRCTECRKDVSDKAASCPHCGAPVDAVAAQAMQTASGTTALKWVSGLLAILIFINFCNREETSKQVERAPVAEAPSAQAAPEPVPDEEMLAKWAESMSDESAPPILRKRHAENIIRDFDGRPEAKTAKEMLPSLIALVEEKRTNGKWQYQNTEEGMSGKRTAYAAVRSENTINLGFPYNGDQRGTLAVRRHPSFGNNVILSIEQGQIICRSRDCPVRIRYDDAAPVTYSGLEPADNSSETVFLPYAIATRLKSAKRVRVEINLYQNGIQVLEFNVKGFDPDKMNEQK